MSYLAEPTHVEFIEDPYRVWVVDGFLDKNIVDSLLEVWPENDDECWFRGRQLIEGKPNVLEQGMLALSDVRKMSPFLRIMMEEFHSDEMTSKIAEITGESDLVSDDTMRWSGIRTMLEGSHQLIHSDARRRNAFSTLKKHLTVMLYLNPNYKPEDDGCLEMWDDDMKACQVRIEPRLNRLVIFENSDTSYHGVPTVNAERRALTFSIMQPDTGLVTSRVKARFVARPQDPPEVDALGLKRSQLDDY